jgi:adenosylcobyric acid synthase
MPADCREQVVGTLVTKFRGDASLLESGFEELAARTGVPNLGVLPYDDPGLPAEDSVSLPDTGGRAVFGDDDGVPDAESVTVAVPRLGRISNFTDLEPLAEVPGVRVTYVPPEAPLNADAVVLPGTKNTVDDLLTLHDAGFGETLAAFEGPVVGLCGGYQMLGERLTDATLEGTGDVETVAGFGLLPVETRFTEDKHVEETTVEVDGCGPLAGATGVATGYEIHTGRTEPVAPVERPLGPGSAAVGDTLGTYLHGLFENDSVRAAFVTRLFERTGTPRPEAATDTRDPYTAAAALVARAEDLTALFDDVA